MLSNPDTEFDPRRLKGIALPAYPLSSASFLVVKRILLMRKCPSPNYRFDMLGRMP
jgi:hypothetical protein